MGAETDSTPITTDANQTSNGAAHAKTSNDGALAKVTSALARASTNGTTEDGHKYPAPAKLAVIMASLYVSVFLIALDRTIIGVAVPKITDEFHSINDIGWYGSSYMLTASAFILFYGRVYTFFRTKWVFLTGIFLFEVGSALCGAAPNSTTFIVGRAIAGFGSSGIFTGAISILLASVPLHKRPIFQGLFGACFGVASVAGPLIGGAFTQGKAGWRWCFYVNLPLGGFTILALAFLLKLEEDKPPMPWKEIIYKLDPLGNFLFLPSLVCLLLALQWGGIQYPWSDGRVIALFVVFGVVFILWIVVQYFERHTNATVPSRIVLERSVFFGGIYQFTLGACFITTVLYIPLWFQAIKGVSPVKSGINTIPMILGLVIASVMSGAIVHRVGYYTQFIYLGVVLMAIGSGLMTTLKPDSGHAKWIGYQVVLGLGIGVSMQQSNLAVQTCLADRDVPTGTSVIFFFQTLGGAVFSSVGQNTFIDKFLKELAKIDGIDGPRIVRTGATALRGAVPIEKLPAVVVGYNYALTHGPFFVSTIVACLAVFGAAGMEWRSVKEKKNAQVGVGKKIGRKEKDIEADAEVGSTESVPATNTTTEKEHIVPPSEVVGLDSEPAERPTTGKSKETAA